MMLMMMTMMMSMGLPVVVMLMTSILSKKSIYDREKTTPFECGFDPQSFSRMPFSLRFFLIAMIFLIFDVKIALILPMVMVFNSSSPMWWTLTTLFFITILILGLYHEWNQGVLQWAE
uniref:NADH-ubiquinone oxidoreductase chain 3 n=1 Tax=Pielomastax zhengi TaxID=997267 RepID=G8DZ99_9ORTH|nr:NADH dehydrogenase subunit 3 [Pielomastax zhengi]ADZ62108.1 NADH dehydrogenase subunit 3 [Pielomastax zhengi]